MNIIKKAIAYLRCSTDLQEMSIADQKKAIEAYAKKHGIVIIKYFIDEGVSGRYAEERPAFMGMMEYVKHYHDFQYVLCYDVSRWGRFIKPQEATYWEVLINKQGKDVVYVTEGFRDDGNIGDSVMKVIKNSEASEYAMKLSKTSFRGHKSWAEKGYFVGGKPKYGFDRALYDENDKFVRVLKKGECKATKTQHVKLVPNREQKRIVQKIFNMRTEERLGLRSIANKLNEIVIPSPNGGKWSSSTIWYMLGDEVYIGDIIYNKQKVDNLHEQDKKKVWGRYKPKDQWIICKGAHKPIITREQFAKVLEVNETAFRKHKQFRGTGRRHTVPYLLSGGMIKCKECHHNYQGHSNRSHGNENFYYRCGGYHMKGKSVCNLWSIPRDKAEQYAIEGIHKRITSPEWVENIQKHLKKIMERNYVKSDGEINQIEKDLKNIEQGMNKLLDAIEQGLDKDTAINRINTLKAKKNVLLNRRSILNKEDNLKDSVDVAMAKIMGYMDDFKGAVKKSSFNNVRALLDKFMLPVEVHTADKKVQYSFLKVPMSKQLSLGYFLPSAYNMNSPHHIKKGPA